MKKLFILIAAVLTLVFAQGCNFTEKAKEIKITSFKVNNVTPAGLRSVDVALEMEIDNPTMGFTVETFEAVVKEKKSGEAFFTMTGGPVKVKRRCTEKYDFTCNLELDKGFSLFSLLGKISDMDPSNYVADIKATVKAKGVRKNLAYDNYPLQKLMDR
ncbi:MAG: hypothetical protein K5984_03050 [Bacteroidales bacterium]|nr:hypothetical protein [Bacteroidales bacterium]